MSEKKEGYNHRCSIIANANATVSVNLEDDRLQNDNSYANIEERLAAWRRRNEEKRISGDDFWTNSDSQETRTTTKMKPRRCCFRVVPRFSQHTITNAAAAHAVTSSIRILVPSPTLLYLFTTLLYCCCCCDCGSSSAAVLRRNEPQQRLQELVDVEPQGTYVQTPSPPLTYMALRRNTLLLAAPALLLSSQQQQEQQERTTAFLSKSGSNALNALRIPPPPLSVSAREATLPDKEISTPNRPFITSPFQHRPFFFGLMAPSAIVSTRTLLDQLKANAKALSDRSGKAESLSNVVRKVEKRRLVVRVPFAQNPDNMQLSRIYKSLFTQQKQKKRPSMDDTYRHVGDDNNNNNNIDDGKLFDRKL